MKELLTKEISAHAAALERGTYSSLELTRAFLEHIRAVEEERHAFLCVDEEGAIAAARAADERRAKGARRGALDGIPFSLKDNVAATGLPMTCASQILKDFRSPYDATVTARLKRAGAVLLGKNNMDEFAMGSTGEYSAFAPVPNPLDPHRVAGGSSGGSASAVAGGEAVFAIGTDTGGSVRQPAAFCGVYGLKPTYGLLSRYGVAAMASSMDCVGLLTRTPADALLLLQTLVGKDPMDATSIEACALSDRLEAPARLRVAVAEEMLTGAAYAESAPFLRRAIQLLDRAGAEIFPVRLPDAEQTLAAYTVLAATEAASNLARYDGVRYGSRRGGEGGIASLYGESRGAGFGEEVKRRILFGTDMLRTENRERYYLSAVRMRTRLRREALALLGQYDLLLLPTAPTAALPMGSTRSPEQMYYADLCSVYANLAGFPALSLPCGKDAAGLPGAVQLCALPGREMELLNVAHLLQAAELARKEGADEA